MECSPPSSRIVCVLDVACASLELAIEELIGADIVLDVRVEKFVEGDLRVVDVK